LEIDVAFATLPGTSRPSTHLCRIGESVMMVVQGPAQNEQTLELE
jgi:hypothetical protein